MTKPSDFSPPPPVTCGEERVIHFAILDDSVGYRAGHFLDGEGINKVPCLAICQYEGRRIVTLYCCDAHGDFLSTIGDCDSLAAAKQRAERIWPGSLACWTEAQFTQDDVNCYLDECQHCTFCNRTPSQRRAQTFYGLGRARICGSCVENFHEDLHQPNKQE